MLPCSVAPNQPQAPPTGQQAQAMLPCSVAPNQPQAPPTGQQAQAVPPCSVPPNQPQAQAPPTGPQSAPLPPVFPIGMHNVPLAVGQRGYHPNAQLLYGPLVPQNDEDHLLCGRQQTIVMYNCIIQKCYTCNVRYDPNFMCPPHNMVICSKTRRSRIINGSKIRCKDYTNAYYCIDNIACLRKELPGTVRDHMYMGNFYFQSVTLGHKAVLEEYGYWKHIVKNRDEVIRTGTLKFN